MSSHLELAALHGAAEQAAKVGPKLLVLQGGTGAVSALSRASRCVFHADGSVASTWQCWPRFSVQSLYLMVCGHRVAERSLAEVGGACAGAAALLHAHLHSNTSCYCLPVTVLIEKAV